MRAHALRRRLPHADGLSRPNPCAAQTLNTVGVVSGCARPIEGRAGARRNGRASGAPWGRSRGGRRPVRCTCTRRTVVGCDQGACASDPAPGGTGEAEVAAWRAEAGRTACRNPPKPDTPIGHPVRRPPRGPTVDPHTGSANRTNEHPSVDRPEQQGARQLQHTGPWAPSTGRTTARTTRALRGAVRWLSRWFDLRWVRALGPGTSFSSTASRSRGARCVYWFRRVAGPSMRSKGPEPAARCARLADEVHGRTHRCSLILVGPPIGGRQPSHSGGTPVPRGTPLVCAEAFVSRGTSPDHS
jgi:hypothetical protein